MSDEVRLFDTNILVHAYTISDERKHALALALVERVWAGEEAATTLQNLCEFFFVVTRKVTKPISPSEAESVLRGILVGSQWTVIDRTPDTVFKAIEFLRRSRTHFWDALIAACMLEHDVHTIVTENERDFKKIPGITVINPFKKVRLA
ncbi:MAG: PIN domain-containing protein [Candidatus Binatia bacterium]